MKKINSLTFFLTVFLSLLYFSCSNLETGYTASIGISIPIKSIVENASNQGAIRDEQVLVRDDSSYGLKITLNVDGQEITQSNQGTLEELSSRIFTFNDLKAGATAFASCEIKKDDKIFWTGKSEKLTISAGTNNVEIIMTKVQQDEPPVEEHEHTFSEKWSSDDDYHWHVCSCGAKSDAEKHTWVEVITEATVGNAGEIKYTCSVCGRTKTEIIPALDAASNGTITPEYAEYSFSLATFDGTALETNIGGEYQVPLGSSIKVCAKDSSGAVVSSEISASSITLYQNEDSIASVYAPSSGGDPNDTIAVLTIPSDLAGSGYRVYVTETIDSVEYDKWFSLEIVENTAVID